MTLDPQENERNVKNGIWNLELESTDAATFACYLMLEKTHREVLDKSATESRQGGHAEPNVPLDIFKYAEALRTMYALDGKEKSNEEPKAL